MKKLFLFIASSQMISATLAFAGQPISPSEVRGLVENSIPPLETNFKIGETWECTTFSWDSNAGSFREVQPHALLIFRTAEKSDDLFVLQAGKKKRAKMQPYGLVEELPNGLSLLTRSGDGDRLVSEGTVKKSITEAASYKGAPDSLQDSKLLAASYRICVKK
jgi:hypothetical protein